MVDEEKHKKRELQLKYLSVLVAAIGTIGVIFSIINGLKDQTEAINSQWNQKFYEEKIGLYVRATELAGRIVSLKSINIENPEMVTELQSTIVEFRSLFWGPMAIVEKPDVESAMVKFNKGLENSLSSEKLGQLVLRLSHICKNEVRVEFNTGGQQSRYGSNKDLLEEMDNILSDGN